MKSSLTRLVRDGLMPGTGTGESRDFITSYDSFTQQDIFCNSQLSPEQNE